jgi:hypothetical protein
MATGGDGRGGIPGQSRSDVQCAVEGTEEGAVAGTRRRVPAVENAGPCAAPGGAREKMPEHTFPINKLSGKRTQGSFGPGDAHAPWCFREGLDNIKVTLGDDPEDMRQLTCRYLRPGTQLVRPLMAPNAELSPRAQALLGPAQCGDPIKSSQKGLVLTRYELVSSAPQVLVLMWGSSGGSAGNQPGEYFGDKLTPSSLAGAGSAIPCVQSVTYLRPPPLMMISFVYWCSIQ